MMNLEPFEARRAALIYNPVARGLSRHPHSLQRTIAVLARQGIQATTAPTTGPGSATTQARKQIEAGCDLIIVAGGDGTINEAANGMLNTGVPLAILPGGTANVLAHEIQIAGPMDRAAARLAQWCRGVFRRGGCSFLPARRARFFAWRGRGSMPRLCRVSTW